MSIDPVQLATLSAILRTGSFDAAAQALGVTQSAVSQRLKALETRIGAALVRRGQPCTGTDIGRRLAAHADHVDLLEAKLVEDIASLAPTPLTPIRIAVNADSLATWFLDALAAVPDHLFDLVIDDQDHSADWLRRGEVLGAVTASQTPVAGCDVIPLGVLRYIPTASPAFIARHFANGVTAQAIADAPMMRFNAADRLQHRWVAREFGDGISPPCHSIASSEGFVQAAILGIGWGLNPIDLVRRDIDDGRLVPLLPDRPMDVPLYWQSSRLMDPALGALTQTIRRTARRLLRPRPVPTP